MVDVVHFLGVLACDVARIDQVHLAVGLERQVGLVVGIPALDVVRVAAHGRFQFHQRGIAIAFGAILVGSGETGGQEQHQFHVGAADLVAGQPASQPAHIEERP